MPDFFKWLKTGQHIETCLNYFSVFQIQASTSGELYFSMLWTLKKKVLICTPKSKHCKNQAVWTMCDVIVLPLKQLKSII
jgi:hypothetical protein